MTFDIFGLDINGHAMLFDFISQIFTYCDKAYFIDYLSADGKGSKNSSIMVSKSIFINKYFYKKQWNVCSLKCAYFSE